MNTLDQEFRLLLKKNDQNLAGLDSHSGAVYGLWEDFRFAYQNPAWFRFAADNGGESRISREWGLGRSIFDCLSGDVKKYYETNYNRCLGSHKVWCHDYECSSDEIYRKFHQTVYPFVEGQGLLIVNSLANERPHNPSLRQARAADESQYLDKNRLICQCSICRLVENFQEVGRWDWVPEWVRNCPPNTSHTFCPICYPHHFRDPYPNDV